MITAIIPKLPFINKEETSGFYTEILGFQLIADYPDYLIMTKDQTELHFFAYPSLKPLHSDFMIYVRLDEGIEPLFELCKKEKVKFPAGERLIHQAWGQTEFAITDPNGTLLTFGQAY